MKTWIWIVIIAVVAVVSVTLSVVFLTAKPQGQIAEVLVDGEVVYSVDLSQVAEPYDYVVETPYGRNTLRIEKGRICVLDADCPHHECVEQGYIRDAAYPLVCLPHHLVVQIRKASDVDTVSS